MFRDPDMGPTPPAVRVLTHGTVADEDFISESQSLARFLTTQQLGAMSPGLLCLMDIACGTSRAIGILKLEREEGAQLQLADIGGGRAFELSVLDSLVLTESTRLFKAALFVRRNRTTFSAAVCDGQRSVHSGDDVAHFWLNFLGCEVLVEPRVATHRWFEATVRFINEYVPDAEKKSQVYDHLVSELRSNRTTVTPQQFTRDYLPRDLQDTYSNFLRDNGVGTARFTKDTADLSSKLRRKSLHTSRGIQLSVPIEQEELVEITAEDITISDTLERYR
jgi:hypothetical protein